VRARIAIASLLWLAGCGRIGFAPSDAHETRDASMDALAPDAPVASTMDAPAIDAVDVTEDAVSIDAPTLDTPPLDAPVDTDPTDGTTTDVAMPDALVATDVGNDAFSAPDAASTCGALRLHYRFEEATGAVIDESGCGNDGTPNAVLTGQTGRVGSAYLFNRVGVSDAHVLVPDSPSLSALSEMTVEAWVRHTGGNFQAIVGHGDLMDGDPFVLHTYSSRDPSVSFGNHPTCTGVASFRSLVTLPVDAWSHVAFTYDATTRVLVHYRDGVEVFRENTPYTPSTICDGAEAMLVGAGRPDGTWGWQGLLDELRIWGVVRTEDEICTDAGGVPSGASCAFP
jgi:hypothetical protein